MRLIAEDIAGEIGMSRMPVREAFRRLDADDRAGWHFELGIAIVCLMLGSGLMYRV